MRTLIVHKFVNSKSTVKWDRETSLQSRSTWYDTVSSIRLVCQRKAVGELNTETILTTYMIYDLVALRSSMYEEMQDLSATHMIAFSGEWM